MMYSFLHPFNIVTREQASPSGPSWERFRWSARQTVPIIMKIIDILYETKFPVCSPFYILSIHFLWWNRHFGLFILYILVVFKVSSYLHSRLGKPSRTSVARPSCRRLDRLLQRVSIWEWLRLRPVMNFRPLRLRNGEIEFPNLPQSKINLLCSKPSEFLCKLWDWYQSRMATSGEQWFDFVEKIYRENISPPTQQKGGDLPIILKISGLIFQVKRVEHGWTHQLIACSHKI